MGFSLSGTIEKNYPQKRIYLSLNISIFSDSSEIEERNQVMS